MSLPWSRPLLAIILSLGASGAPLLAQAPTTLVQAPGYAALVGAFPQPGSDGAKADEAVLMWLQRTRTPEEVLRAQSEVVPHLGLFSAVMGRELESGQCPLTAALARQAEADLRKVTGALKLAFARPRPYAVMPQLSPAVHREPSLSYPSGHSAWGMVEAAILARLEPAQAPAIEARGRLVGYDRALAGVHYPSDVEAGQRLGQAFAAAWLADPANLARLEEARAAEW